MPKGPFNFPRITNIGPFSEIESEQEFKREIKGEVRYTNVIDREISTLFDVDMDKSERIRSSLNINKTSEESDDILSQIKSEFDNLVFPKDISFMRYWINKESSVALIKGIATKEDFRNMGIATTLKKKELDYMKSRGIDLVFTDIVSESGYRLASKTDFSSIHELHTNTGILEYNEKSNRGVMFKRLQQ